MPDIGTIIDRFHARWSRSRALAATASGAVMVALICAAWGSSAGAKSTSAKTPTLQTVSMEVPSYGFEFVPFYFATIYKKYGIKLDIIDLPPPTAVPAVEDQKIDFMTTVGSALASAVKGATLRIVDIQENHEPWAIVGGQGITKMSQLRGQTIIGESAVGEENLIEEAALQHAGVPVTSVKFSNETGGQSVYTRLVESGTGAATAADFGFVYPMIKAGYHVLTRLTWFLTPAQGLATSTTLIATNPSLVKRMVRATVEATAKVAKDEKAAVARLEKAPFNFTKAKAVYCIKGDKPYWTKDGKVSRAVLTAEANALKVQLGMGALPDVTKYIDNSFLPKGSSK